MRTLKIIDKCDRDYLRAVIKPFRNEVEMIMKLDCPDGREFIAIILNGDECVPLPPFDPGTQFTGMEINVPYSLEALEL